jgi:hypothetical protein
MKDEGDWPGAKKFYIAALPGFFRATAQFESDESKD